MPPPDGIEAAAACIDSLRVLRFAADPTAIRAGEATVLRWSVDTSGCARPGLAGLTLNGAPVSASGTRELRPSGTITYRLVARSMGIVRSLGRLEITVDDSSCNPVELPESEVAPLIQGSVKSSIEAYNADPATKNKVTLRRDPTADIEPDGIVIRLRMKLEINNFFDPDVDVDARIRVAVSTESRALVFYQSFTVDVDWPWWVTGMTLGITKIVEEFIDGEVEGKIRQRMLDDLRDQIDAFISLSGGVVSSIETQQDRVVVMVCS